MEIVRGVNPERVRWCCADQGITPDVLAAQVGIAPITLQHLMQGQDSLTFNQLRKIAQHFNRGVLFFLEPGPVDETALHTQQFRTLANQKPELTPKLKALIERVEKQREIYLGLLEELDDPERPRFSPPNFQGQDIRSMALIVREWLRLGDRNSFDTYREAVEARGILVFRSNGYNGKWQIPKESSILGFSLYAAEWPVIVVRKSYSDAQQTFTLMHELGHLLIHRISSIDDERDFQSRDGQEREANAFAGQLLVPDSFLDSIDDTQRPEDVSDFDVWLQEPRRAWGVSSEVILRRLLDANRLSQSLYNSYRQWRAQLPNISKSGGSRAYRFREPQHVFGNTFVRTVLDAINSRQVTLAKGSSYLDGLKIKDLHHLERFYADI